MKENGKLFLGKNISLYHVSATGKLIIKEKVYYRVPKIPKSGGGLAFAYLGIKMQK